MRPRGGGGGHPLGQDGRLPRGLSLLQPVGQVRVTGESDTVPRSDRTGRGGSRDQGVGRVGVLHRAGGARTGPTNHGTTRLRHYRRAGCHRDERGRERGHSQRGPGARTGRRRRSPLQPQPRNGTVVLPSNRDHPHLGGARRDLRPRAPPRHGAVLWRAARDGRIDRAATRVDRGTRAQSDRPRCR